MNYQKRNKKYHNAKGLYAEKWVGFWLKLQGYQVLERRFKTPVGEIDLILKRRNMIVFCEIKTRPTFQEGLNALSSCQKKRIIQGARFFQAKNPQFFLHDFRFDYIVVSKGLWRHIKDAWQVTSK